jgi:ferredoxin
MYAPLGSNCLEAGARMADRNDRVPENVAGRFYVDATCIDCDLCRETAPRNFKRNDSQHRSFVFHQPLDATDEAACLAALEECPVEAIGSDGGEIDDASTQVDVNRKAN